MTTCTHGQLARQCPICERDAEIARLKQEQTWHLFNAREWKADRDRLAAENERLTNHLKDIREACMRDELFRMFTEQEFWHAHHVDIVWRYNGEDRTVEADWLKDVWYGLRAALGEEGKDV